MASNVTRTQHLLNGRYFSNDGGDSGITIHNTGQTTINASGSLLLDGLGDYMDIADVNLGTANTVSWWQKRSIYDTNYVTEETHGISPNTFNTTIYNSHLEIPIGADDATGGGYYVYLNPAPTTVGTVGGPGFIIVQTRDGEGSENPFYLSDFLYNAMIGAWAHIVVVRTATTTFKLYINGVQRGASTEVRSAAGLVDEITVSGMTQDTIIDRIGAGSAHTTRTLAQYRAEVTLKNNSK